MVSDDFNLSWVHISDLHFGQNNTGAEISREEIIFNHLIEDLANTLPVLDGEKPYIFITGDIAFSALNDEYKQAKNFIEKLMEIGIEKSKIYIVPGNHDVDREAFKKSSPTIKLIYKGLRNNPEEIDSYLKDPNDSERKGLKENIWFKLENFCSFTNTNGFQEISHEHEFWSEDKYNKVCLVGLNSVLLSYDDTDSPTNLALGNSQITNAFNDKKNDKLLVILQHHPPDWLLVNKNYFINEIGYRPHLILCGHTHSQQVTINLDLGQKEYITFNAGSVYEKEGKSQELVRYTYYLGKLTNKGLTFWPRVWSRGKDKFDIDNDFFNTTGDYVFHPANKLPKPLYNWLNGDQSSSEDKQQDQQPELKTELGKIGHINKITEALKSRRSRTNKSKILCKNKENEGCELETDSIGLGRKVYESDKQSHKIASIINDLDEIIGIMHEMETKIERTSVLLIPRIQNFYLRTYNYFDLGQSKNTELSKNELDQVKNALLHFFIQDIKISEGRNYFINIMLNFFNDIQKDPKLDLDEESIHKYIYVTQGVINELINIFEKNMRSSSLSIEKIINEYDSANTISTSISSS